ncbi:MAG: response regulator [Chloroflexota bacterium]
MPQESPTQAHICIVDDNPMAREVIMEQLSIEPYRVTQVPSGLELLEQLGTLQPDVILMDVMMPQMDGMYEVCHQIKQNTAYQHIHHPGYRPTSREDMLHGPAAGADEFLSKPVNGPELPRQSTHHAAHQAAVRLPPS